MQRIGLVLAVLALVVTGCGTDGEAPVSPAPRPRPAHSSTPAATNTPPTIEPDQPSPLHRRPEKPPTRLRGIDASHHQGAIDWAAVAGDGISFAYLKATEGTSYTDPTFTTHRAAAQDADLRVGGYHYFQLCSPGVEQAAHFAEVLGDLGRLDLPPAVDLELVGSCSTPPTRPALLAEVRAFLARVEADTGRKPIVYLYPDFEAEYAFAAELGDYRQWVRSLDGKPDRDWWIWQQTDSGSVAGIDGPVDVDVMAR